MSPPLVIPQSRDTGDTRPNANGMVPSVHYNVPMYQSLQTQQGWGPNNPVVDGLMRIMAGVTGGTVQNIKQNYNPTSLTGALNLASILVPGAGKGEPTGGQQMFLDSINRSSRSLGPALYPKDDPNVSSLSERTGLPVSASKSPDRRLNQARNPLSFLLEALGHPRLGMERNTGVPGTTWQSLQDRMSNMTYKELLDVLNNSQGNN